MTVTACVLTYGDHAPLVRRAVESILRHCPRELCRLVVGANAPSAETLEYLRSETAIDRLIVSPTNINKCPMMRRMFEGIDTEFIWWFDDDSHVKDDRALPELLEIARAAPASTAMWGSVFCCTDERDFSHGADVAGFVRSASWYRGKPPPGYAEPAARWVFATGGCWLIRTRVVRALDWPDPRLIKRADDVLLAEAIRQQGWSLQDVGGIGVEINTAPRRGEGEDRETMARQTAPVPADDTPPPGRGAIFILTSRDTALLEENFAGQDAGIDLHVCDNNIEPAERDRVRALCEANGWSYTRSDLSDLNRAVWEGMTTLGRDYDYVVKMEPATLILDPAWHHRMARLLCGRAAIAGTPEYRDVRDVASFWTGRAAELTETVLHFQGGILGMSREALRLLRDAGCPRVPVGPDCCLSYMCHLLGIEFFPDPTTGSWFAPYRPPLREIAHLRAIHPLTRFEWSHRIIEP